MGRNTTLPSEMASGELIEAITTKYSGYREITSASTATTRTVILNTVSALVSLIFFRTRGFSATTTTFSSFFPSFSLWDEGNSALCPSQII